MPDAVKIADMIPNYIKCIGYHNSDNKKTQIVFDKGCDTADWSKTQSARVYATVFLQKS